MLQRWMRPTWSWTAGMCMALLCVPGSSLGATRSLAVLEFIPKAKAVSPETAQVLTDVVRAAAAEGLRGTGFTVVSRDIIDQTLAELEKRGEKCDLGSCDAEIAGNLGASHFVTGEITRLGKSLVVTVKLSRQSDNVLMGSKVVRAKDEEHAFDELAAPTRELMGLLGTAPAVAPVAVAPTPAPVVAPAPAPALPSPPAAVPAGPRPGEEKLNEKSGLTLVWIPGGTFSMGCATGDKECDADEKPPRQVKVDGFWLGKTEVTVEAYARCAAAGACNKAIQGQDSSMKSCNWKNGRMDHPMNCVNWEESRDFCRWAGLRLPDASEWEYAAKGGADQIYPWGNERISGKRANFCDVNCPRALNEAQQRMWTEKGWISKADDDGYAGTAPVGSYPRGVGAWGVLDMIGNVWEWTASNYDDKMKEFRGGSWINQPAFARASDRSRYTPDARSDVFGFRCGL